MVKDDAEAQELAEAALRERSFKLMRAECNVEGDCRLASGATVMMKYVGQPFDGEYITHAVIHRFSLEEGYITNFFLKRNMVDEEYMKGPTHVDMHSGKSPAAGKKAAAEEPEDNYGDEEYQPLLKEILSVKCCDKDGSETTTCTEGEPLTVEVKCNASVEEGATVTFNIYREGDDPERDEPVETLTANVRQNRARVELDSETIGRIIGTVIGGVAGGAIGARIGRAAGESIARRFFFTADSAGCEQVRSGVVEIEAEESAQIVDGLLVHDRIIQQPTSTGHDIGVKRQLTAIDRITVHHTVSTQNPYMDDVNNWWKNRLEDGGDWDRAGYHFLIRGDGLIWQLVPVHAASWGAGKTANLRSIHIALAGNFVSDLPTQAARDSFGFLCRVLLGNTQLPNLYDATAHIMGHREWDNRTRCPGFSKTQYLSWV